jgi:hypothetical protein
MRIGVFYRTSASVLSGSVTVTVTGNNVSAAWIERWDAPSGETWDIAITGGADASAGAAYSAVTSSVSAGFIQAGDGVSVVTITPTDTNPTTWGSPTLTAQGGGSITPGTITQRQLLSTASGSDMGGRQVTFVPSASTQAVGTLTWAYTATGTTTNHSGPTAVIRIRSANVPVTVSPSVVVGTTSFGSATISAYATVSPPVVACSTSFGTVSVSTGTASPAVMGTPVTSANPNNTTNTSLAVALGSTTIGDLNVIEISGLANGTTVNPTMTTPAGWTKLLERMDTNGTPA